MRIACDCRVPSAGSKLLEAKAGPTGSSAAVNMRCNVPSAKFAISYTVKNESRLLPSAIRYHIVAGCSRIYIFWDGTTDGSESLVSEFPNVVARNSIKPDEIDDPPAWIARVVSCWELIMDVRKNINTFYAAKEAAKDGIDLVD